MHTTFFDFYIILSLVVFPFFFFAANRRKRKKDLWAIASSRTGVFLRYTRCFDIIKNEAHQHLGVSRILSCYGLLV